MLLTHIDSKYTLKETRTLPFELIVSLDYQVSAKGLFILDDGLSSECKQQQITVLGRVAYDVAKSTDLVCLCTPGRLDIQVSGDYREHPDLRSVTILGVLEKPESCRVAGRDVSFYYDRDLQRLQMVELGVSLHQDLEMLWA